MTMFPRQRNSGFSLVEILVVIAVITVLAAIIFPVFSSVREGGRRATCSSNLRQIGLAMRMYVSDSNGSYPFIFQPSGCRWVDAIYPYAKSEAILSCPNVIHGEYHAGCMPDVIVSDANSEPIIPKGSYDLVSRQTFVKVAQSGTSSSYALSQQDRSEARYRFPSSTALVTDAGKRGRRDHDYYSVVAPGVNELKTLEDLQNEGIEARHGDGANLLFVDGHVKWMKLESMIHSGMWRADGSDTPPPVVTR